MSKAMNPTMPQKSRTLISAGGDGLDVWWDRGGTWVLPVLEANAALPLNDYLDKVDGFWDTVDESAIKPHTDGNIYAIPCEEVFWEIILYNKEIFLSSMDSKPPKPWMS